jgi:hypothetical protein
MSSLGLEDCTKGDFPELLNLPINTEMTSQGNQGSLTVNHSLLETLVSLPEELIERVFSNFVKWTDFKKFYDQLSKESARDQQFSILLRILAEEVTELDFTNGVSIREPWTHPLEPWIHPKYPTKLEQIVNRDRQVTCVTIQEFREIWKFLFDGYPSYYETLEYTSITLDESKTLPKLQRYRIALDSGWIYDLSVYFIIADPRARYLNIFSDNDHDYSERNLEMIISGLEERSWKWGSEFILAIPGLYYIEGTLWITMKLLKKIDNYNFRNGHDLRSLQIKKLIIDDRLHDSYKFTIDTLRVLNNNIPTIIFAGKYLNNVMGVPIPSGTRTVYILIESPEFGSLNPKISREVSPEVTEVFVHPSRALREDFKNILERRFPNARVEEYQIPVSPVYE